MLKLEAFLVFLFALVCSGAAGLAAMLRSRDTLCWKGMISSFLNSGLLGLAISLVWYVRFQENLYMLVGICVLAGLGGVATVELALNIFKERMTNKKDNPP